MIAASRAERSGKDVDLHSGFRLAVVVSFLAELRFLCAERVGLAGALAGNDSLLLRGSHKHERREVSRLKRGRPRRPVGNVVHLAGAPDAVFLVHVIKDRQLAALVVGIREQRAFDRQSDRALALRGKLDVQRQHRPAVFSRYASDQRVIVAGGRFLHAQDRTGRGVLHRDRDLVLRPSVQDDGSGRGKRLGLSRLFGCSGLLGLGRLYGRGGLPGYGRFRGNVRRLRKRSAGDGKGRLLRRRERFGLGIAPGLSRSKRPVRRHAEEHNHRQKQRKNSLSPVFPHIAFLRFFTDWHVSVPDVQAHCQQERLLLRRPSPPDIKRLPRAARRMRL